MEMNFNEHLENKEINLSEFEHLCKRLFAQRSLVEDIDKKLSEANAQLEEYKTQILGILEKTGKDKYPVTGLGTVFVQHRTTVSMPKDPEKKKAFFDYLKNRNLLDDLTTVHSQTLNSFYKAEMGIAVSEGNSDFKMPGLDEPRITKILAMRKG